MSRLYFALVALLLAGAAPARAAEPYGLWATEDGESKIKIAPCGPKLCGTLAWLKDPNDAAGKPLLDASNTSTALRTRPLLGVPLLQGLTREGNIWKGKIYNPEDGKTYDGTLALTSDGRAELKGCVAVVFCQSDVLLRQ